MILGTYAGGQAPRTDYNQTDPNMADYLVGREIIARHFSDENNPHKSTAEQVGARPNTWLPTIAEIGAAPSHPATVQFVDKVGWFRIGELSAYNSFRLTINTIYDMYDDNGAIVDIVATYASPLLSKLSTQTNLNYGLAVDQVRLVQASASLYYVDFHYNVSLSNRVVSSISGAQGAFTKYAEYVEIADSDIGGYMVAAISLAKS